MFSTKSLTQELCTNASTNARLCLEQRHVELFAARSGDELLSGSQARDSCADDHYLGLRVRTSRVPAKTTIITMTGALLDIALVILLGAH